MRGKSLLALLLCLAVLLSAAPLAFAEPAQEEKEWVIRHISSVEDLEKLAEDCRLDSYSRNLHVVLDKDLDLEGTAIQPIPSFGGSRGRTGAASCAAALRAASPARTPWAASSEKTTELCGTAALPAPWTASA